MRVAAVVAVSSFPYWKHTFTELCKVADDIYVNWDKNTGDPEILHCINEVCGDTLKGIVITESPWQCPNWREECMRVLDDIEDSELPDVILTPDQDEVYGNGIKDDLQRLWISDKNSLEFDYEPLPSSDGRVINEGVPYPPDPHVKAFKYRRGLSYLPYHGDGKVAQYHNSILKATSKIKHYTAYTPAMEQAKPWRSHTNNTKATKAVTMVGFGPSAYLPDMVALGEVWTCNNGYDVLCPELYSRTTRIFEMHQRGKLEARDKENKTNHLSGLNKAGDVRRIIMQQPWDDIQGSERYPRNDVKEANMGLPIFSGTPIWMLALAIYEGYNHIRVYGLDQLDWEHTLQREGWMHWMGVAKGRGITVDGELTFMDRFTKDYGYEYGPEWCDYQQTALWDGHPIEVKYKTPSRAVLGEAFRKGVR